MDEGAEALATRLGAVRRTIAAAARRVGRDPAEVRIVAVTKTLPPTAVRQAVAAGLPDIGESYVQEARAKQAHVPEPAVWHLIGGLQRNKVRAAAEVFAFVHTVDSVALAHDLDRAAVRCGRRLDVLAQVNVSGEATKRGVMPDDLAALGEVLCGLRALRWVGLMTIPAPAATAELVRPGFRALRALRDDVAARLGVELPHLSMGMSDDFAVAVEEGATMVRLGRALFGPRGRASWREGS